MPSVKGGTADYSAIVRIVDSTDGTPETGVTSASGGLALWYWREGGTVTALTESDLTNLDDAHADGAFKHASDGYYRVCLPDAAVAAGVDWVLVGGAVTGMVVIGEKIDIDPFAGLVTLADDAITAAKYDESTAFPVKSADTGATQIARVGADGDTLETLSDQIDGTATTTELNKVPKSDGTTTWNATALGSIQSEANDAIVANRLDELLAADSDIDGAAPPTVGSVFHELMSKTAGSFTYDQTTDSNEAIKDAIGVPGDLGGGATIAANLADIEGQTDDIGVAGAGLTALATATELAKVPKSDSNVSWNATALGAIQSEANDALVAYDPPTRAELTTDTNSILSKVLKYFQLLFRKDAAIATDNATELTAVNADGGSGVGAYANTTDSVEAIRDNQTTPGAIADQVWEEAIADHSGTSGSTAEALNAAGAAGDPWTTNLPGAYGAGSAGYIVGTNINATVSSRATQASADTLATAAELAKVPKSDSNVTWNATALGSIQSEANDALVAYDPPTRAELTSDKAEVIVEVNANETKIDTVDTVVDAIKLKTDNLPASPANEATLTTIAGYLDTEIAAILADTNELQTDWTNGGRLDLLLDAILADTGTDGVVIADGTLTAAKFGADTNTYQMKVGLVDDEANTTDRYIVGFFKNGQRLSSGITSPTIQIVKIADGTDLVAAASMTQIGSTGAYRYTEATNRITAGVGYIAIVSATIDSSTRSWMQHIGRDSTA